MDNVYEVFPITVQDEDLSFDQHKVGDLVLRDFRTVEVFIKNKIDYCCGGKKTLREACALRGLDLNQVQQDLQEIMNTPANDLQQIQNWDLDYLADYIVRTHHAYVRNSLFLLSELGLKVVNVHGDHHPELKEIMTQFKELAKELIQHMNKEEKILFPSIKSLVALQNQDTPQDSIPVFRFDQPIRVMEIEHDTAEGHLSRINQLSNTYTAPAGACTSYRVFYTMLKEFEEDLHQHVHLENNMLFPKALKLAHNISARM